MDATTALPALDLPHTFAAVGLGAASLAVIAGIAAAYLRERRGMVEDDNQPDNPPDNQEGDDQ